MAADEKLAVIEMLHMLFGMLINFNICFTFKRLQNITPVMRRQPDLRSQELLVINKEVF